MAGLSIRRTVPSTALALTASFMFPIPPAHANESAYTDLSLSHCTIIAEEELGGLYKCPGYENYPVYVTEGDLRQSASFGLMGEERVRKSFESFSQFNYVGSKIEWRLDAAGKPRAAILRWMIENEPGEDKAAALGQVLVVSKVAQQADELGCVIGYVDALQNGEGNALARTIADDTVSDFACGVTQATWHGDKGPASGDPIHSLPKRLSAD